MRLKSLLDAEAATATAALPQTNPESFIPGALFPLAGLRSTAITINDLFLLDKLLPLLSLQPLPP